MVAGALSFEHSKAGQQIQGVLGGGMLGDQGRHPDQVIFETR